MANEARRAYLAEWREKNRQKLREYNRAWLWASPERVERHRATSRQYNATHKERVALNGERWRAENLDRVKMAQRTYSQTDKARERFTRYNHSEKGAENRKRNAASRVNSTRNYRARKAGNQGTATLTQIMARVAYFGARCWVCGGAWDSMDHVIPVSKGGANFAANLRPICRSCNAAKGNRPWPVRKESLWQTRSGATQSLCDRLPETDSQSTGSKRLSPERGRPWVSPGVGSHLETLSGDPVETEAFAEAV